jgi:hypothetical protein
MNSIRFACTSLAGSNKAGTLKPDANGYYTTVVGALRMFNSAGQFYDYEQSKRLFEESSQLMRRVKRGALRGEYGHPKRQIGMSMDAYAHRVLSLHEEMVCCHHQELWLDTNSMRDDKGRPVVAIMSKVLPSGPYGAVLQRQFDNPKENVCFSIRAFTDDYMDRGIATRVLKTVVTFDYVNEPGMAVAEKFKSPALESLDDEVISRGALHRIAQQAQESTRQGLAQESVSLSLEELFTAMNWHVDEKTQAGFRKAGWSDWT